MTEQVIVACGIVFKIDEIKVSKDVMKYPIILNDNFNWQGFNVLSNRICYINEVLTTNIFIQICKLLMNAIIHLSYLFSKHEALYTKHVSM